MGFSMDAIDWNADATLHERDDGGSELHYNFRTLRTGPLAALVREVAGMAAAERARMVIDVAGSTTLNVAEILALASRPDCP
jgi:hypothetical protein